MAIPFICLRFTFCFVFYGRCKNQYSWFYNPSMHSFLTFPCIGYFYWSTSLSNIYLKLVNIYSFQNLFYLFPTFRYVKFPDSHPYQSILNLQRSFIDGYTHRWTPDSYTSDFLKVSTRRLPLHWSWLFSYWILFLPFSFEHLLLFSRLLLITIKSQSFSEL